MVYETEQALYHDRIAKNKKFRETLRNSDDPYLGALRLRYGYALTCHKAQGGEWDNIILHPWFKQDDYRWQYTAITRGRKEVYSY
ncbi:MAG: ATP-binding domain-containing protein [Bacteroidetes bacterium]|nr:ATP-binding domain-containing protein [Bacteroidota bacterium]